MKKILIIISLVLVSFIGNAQIKKDSNISMPVSTARQIAKDLVSGDSAKAVLIQTNKQVGILMKVISDKDSINVRNEQKEVLYQGMLKNDTLKFNTQGIYVGKLEKSNKNLKASKTFIEILSGVAIGLLLIFKK